MSVLVAERPRPILRYPGAKWRIADWIVAHFPPHEVYVEPYCGSAAVLFAKSPVRVETINDLDGRVVNLFRVIRERPGELCAAVAMTPYARAEYDASYGPATGDPIEDARRFLVRVWMAHGGKFGARCGWRHDMNGKRRGPPMPDEWRALPDRLWAVVDRLRDVHVEHRPAIDVIVTAPAGALIYADPPYPLDTLYSRDARLYTHTMTDADHGALLDSLLTHAGPVVLSGYRCRLYDDRLASWQRIDRPTTVYLSSPRVECLWLSPIAVASARQPVLFASVESS